MWVWRPLGWRSFNMKVSRFWSKWFKHEASYRKAEDYFNQVFERSGCTVNKISCGRRGLSSSYDSPSRANSLSSQVTNKVPMEIPLSGVKSVRYLPIHVNHLLMFHRCEVPLEINSTIHDKQIHLSQHIWSGKDHHLIEETSTSPRQLHKTWSEYRCQC